MLQSDAPKPDLQLFVDRLTSRSFLTEQEQKAILALPYKVVQVRENRDFVRLGQKVDHANVLVSGFIGRFDQNDSGQRQITAIHVPGDMADLHSVVQPEGTSALQALCGATILSIPHQAIREVAARYPAVAEAFWRDCAVDAAILSQWVVNVGRRSATARLAHLICEMATRLGALGKGGAVHFPFAVTQAQLAEATGLSLVHVNRTIKALRNAGLVEIRYRNVHILNWKALVAAAEFDKEYLQMDIMPAKRLRFAKAA